MGGHRSADELLRDELMENLARSDLSMLERAIFTYELQRLFQIENPRAGRGGDRRSPENQSATIADWSVACAERTGWSKRTLEKMAAIGRHLDREAAAALQGSSVAHSQKDLERLSRLPAERQAQLAAVVIGRGVATIRDAEAALAGSAGAGAADPDDAIVASFQRLWAKASEDARARILAVIAEGDA